MTKSILELYPTEFAAQKQAWDALKRKFIKRRNLNDVKAILKAEARIFEISNNGRHNVELEAFIELDNSIKRASAKAWFENSENIYKLAYLNAEKVKHLHAPDAKSQDRLLQRIIACQIAIKTL